MRPHPPFSTGESRSFWKLHDDIKILLFAIFLRAISILINLTQLLEYCFRYDERTERAVSSSTVQDYFCLREPDISRRYLLELKRTTVG